MHGGQLNKDRSPRLLVVGGTGFIGRNLAQAARQRGYRVCVLSSGRTRGEQTEDGIDHLKADIGNRHSLEPVLAGRAVDYVVNLGGTIHHADYFSGGSAVINAHFNGLVNLVDLLDWSRIKGFVQAGSSDEYGSLAAPQSEQIREAPFSPYSFAKTAGCHFLQMLHRQNRLPVSMVRFFLVYGPGQDRDRFIPQIISGCLKGETFPVSLGEQVRDFCYIDDIVAGILTTLECPESAGQVINLASGRPVSIRSVVEMVRTMVGSGHPDYGRIPYRDGENMALFADISKARSLLGWRPEISLEEGIRRSIAAYGGGS